jgi:transcriptional regulator GlxA family with amidase domain
MRTPRRVVFVAFDRLQSLDLTGPLEAFAYVNRLTGRRHYATEVRAPSGAQITTSSGLRLIPDGGLDDPTDRADTLIVAGGQGVRAAASDAELIAWIAEAAPHARRVASVCTGAFLLARAGLLDGRRATTHWMACGALKREHPRIDVDPAPIFVRDGNVYTSAGVTAGIDLALALVEEDLGSAQALAVARALVLFVRRPGGQAQFSAALAGQDAERDSVRDLQGWIADNLEADLGVETLAARICMSPRNFARVFAREVGLTPAVYVAAVRIERARTLLETTDLQLDQVAVRCGFGTVETFRRAFARQLRVSPSEYRARFAPPTNVISIDRRASA